MGSTLSRPFGSDEVCDLADVSYRQLDYWIRQGLVETIGPAQPGSGGIRRFLRREVRVVAVIARLRELGATEGPLRNVAPMLRAMSEEEWHGDLLVSKSGRVAHRGRHDAVGFGEACWVVNLALAAHRAAA